MKTISFVPGQDLVVRKTKNGTSLIIRAIDNQLNDKGITLEEASGGLYNLHITADSPKILEDDFTINAGDQLTLIVADVKAVTAGEDIGNGQKAPADRAAFKQYRVVGYTPLEQLMKLERVAYQRAMSAQNLANSKAITSAQVEAVKSGKAQVSAPSEVDMSADKW